jgi:hypothetical protein
MGETTLGREATDSPPQSTERSTAEITAQRLYELIRHPAHDELAPEVELIAELPEYAPEATPVPWPGGSSPRLAHTLRRVPQSSAVPTPSPSEIDTRPVAMPIAMIFAPLADAPEDERPQVARPPKRPFAPRTGRERLVLPLALALIFILGAAAFWLLR